MNTTNRVRNLVETRGPKSGQCNLCGTHGPLTEDHTPPKGCYKPNQVELRSILHRLSSSTLDRKSTLSQNGVKFRTICAYCNNTLLGSLYDPPFINFVNQIANYLKSQLELPDLVTVKGQPQAIARSLLGHMAAQGVNRYKKGLDTETFRNYILDVSSPLPGNIRIYYWPHPHQSHIMVRDAAYGSTKNNTAFLFWLLKFFPLAFMVTWDELSLIPRLDNFDRWRNLPFETQSEIPILLRPPVNENWPEAPTDDSVLVYSRDAIDIKRR